MLEVHIMSRAHQAHVVVQQRHVHAVPYVLMHHLVPAETGA